MSLSSAHPAIPATQKWVEQVVIGLTLCPFAKSPFVLGRIRYEVFEGDDKSAFLACIAAEMLLLRDTPVAVCETSLLIHPHILTSFYDYNDFQEEIEAILHDKGLEGEIQVATFHPKYRFAGTGLKAAENFTNRSPYPMLHFLREESIAKAVETYPNIHDIPAKNIATMNAIGFEQAKATLKATRE